MGSLLCRRSMIFWQAISPSMTMSVYKLKFSSWPCMAWRLKAQSSTIKILLLLLLLFVSSLPMFMNYYGKTLLTFLLSMQSFFLKLNDDNERLLFNCSTSDNSIDDKICCDYLAVNYWISSWLSLTWRRPKSYICWLRLGDISFSSYY